MLRKLNKTEIFNKKYKQFYIFLGLSLFSFSLWLLAFWPGVMTYDSLNSWQQIISGHYNNWHPYIYTFCVRALTFLYFSPVTVAIFQIFVSAVLGSYVFYRLYEITTSPCHLEHSGAESRDPSLNSEIVKPQSKIRDSSTRHSVVLVGMTNWRKWIVWLAFLGYITSVTVGIYNITLWKDIIFSQMVVFWGIFLYFLVTEKKELKKPALLIFLGFLLFFTAAVRHNGVVLLLLAPLIFYFAKVVKLKSALIWSSVAVGLYLCSLTAVPRYLGVDMQQPLSDLSKLQLVSAILSSNQPSYDENKHPPLTRLDSLISPEDLRKNYICETIDPLLASKSLNKAAFKDASFKKDFDLIANHLILRNFPQVVGDRACILSSTLLSSSNTKYGNALEDTSPIHDFPDNLGLSQAVKVPVLHSIYLSFLGFSSIFPLNLVLRPLLIPLILFCIGLLFYRKNKPLFFYCLMILCLVPFLLPLLPASDFRYFYFLHFGFFFLIPMFFITNEQRKKYAKK